LRVQIEQLQRQPVVIGTLRNRNRTFPQWHWPEYSRTGGDAVCIVSALSGVPGSRSRSWHPIDDHRRRSLFMGSPASGWALVPAMLHGRKIQHLFHQT
jgi:hypothetical protein